MIEVLEKPAAGPVIRLHEADNVVIARSNVEIGTKLGDGLTCRSQVPSGHKIATRAIKKGEPILKYNVTIGFAAADIAPGTFVHSHNMEFREFDRDYAYAKDYRPVQMIPESERATFMGIVRANGQVATRNYIGVLSTVNCSATVVHKIAEYFTPERLAEYPNIDGVVAFAHGTGCGMEMTGEPMDLLRRTMAGYALHANIASALVVGLGCERNQVSKLFKEQGLEANSRLRSFVMQDEGGTTKTIAAGVAAVKEMLPEANRVTRTRVPASHIMVGLQCGGSDGFSSITANPALGAAMDILVRHGGTAILSETPEIYGVEHTLTRRARSREVGEKLIERIRWWKDEYTVGRDTQINGNVSPGNQTGGLANIFRKVARLVDERRHRSADGGLPLRRARQAARPRVHGHARIRSVFGDRPDRRRRQRHHVHDRARLDVRRKARAVDQARDQHADVQPVERRHGHQLRRHPRRQQDDAADGAGNIRGPAAHGIGRKDQERGPGSRRPRIRAVEYRRDRLKHSAQVALRWRDIAH